MKARRLCVGLLASSALALLGALPAFAQDPWAGQTFLSDYSKLQRVESEEGKDYVYLVPEGDQRVGVYREVLVDEPEIFISAKSPYKGAKPQDLASIATLVRRTATTALEERGYRVIDHPAPDAAYLRLAVTDLQIEKKKRSLLGYTPIGFVVTEGVKAVQDFMDKYELLDFSMQVEVQDSMQHDVLAAAVLKRVRGADSSKRISFDTLEANVRELGERMACRFDNSHVEPSQRINCHDPAARTARPRIMSP